MKVKFVIFGAACSLLVAAGVRADLRSDEMQAYDSLKTIMPQAEALVTDGRADEAELKILAVYPLQFRTPVQSLLLANLLFRQDPKQSYPLHKTAAEKMPDESDAQLEWAMEQHRAGEYAAAADTYAKVMKSQPQNGIVYGLCAECLLRGGKVIDAAQTFAKSESASEGNIDDFESMVCEVNGHLFPDIDRATLMAKVRSGDIVAAQKLIALDCAFQRDWWNNGPEGDYLKHDLDVLNKTAFSDPSTLPELICAGKCGIIIASNGGDASAVLKQAGFLLDKGMTLPKSGIALSTMVAAMQSTKAIPISEARQKWGSAILEQARQNRDAEYFNVAADLYLDTDKLPEIDQLGWDVTGDVRFAASLLTGLLEKDSITLDDPRLLRAVKQFPNDSQVAAVEVILTANAKKPLHDVLVRAIECEYTRFSVQGGLTDRRSAATLRKYFKMLPVL